MRLAFFVRPHQHIASPRRERYAPIEQALADPSLALRPFADAFISRLLDELRDRAENAIAGRRSPVLWGLRVKELETRLRTLGRAKVRALPEPLQVLLDCALSRSDPPPTSPGGESSEGGV